MLPKTIESNITLPVLKKYRNKIGLIDRKTQRASVDKWVDMLDVRPNDPDMLAMQLSGGNQQKVVLAKWISTEAKILIVDEPTNGVDVGAKAEIHQIIRKLASEGTAVIVISSEPVSYTHLDVYKRQGPVSAGPLCLRMGKQQVRSGDSSVSSGLVKRTPKAAV